MNASRWHCAPSRNAVRLCHIVAVAALTLRAVVGPPALAADTLDREVSLDIPAASLSKALLRFGQQVHVQIMLASNSAEGRTVPALKGTFRASSALNILLRDSGLSYRVQSNTVTVAPSAALGVVAAEQPFRLAQGDSSSSADTPTAERSVGPLAVLAGSANSYADGDSRLSALEQVTITGTSINGETPDSSPLTVYTAEDIRSEGVTTIDEFVRKLPQNFSTLSALTASSAARGLPSSGESVGGTAVDLRGLGPGSTLVLINGRRLAPSFSGTAVDVSLIPLNAIDRVEILTDGASSLYGSDAVGGVVNFILKDKFDGNYTTVGYGTATAGGAAERRVEHTSGFHWGTGRAVASFGYLDQADLPAYDRSFAEAAWPLSLIPRQSRWNALLTGAQDIGDSVQIFGDGLASTRDSHLVTSSKTKATTSEAFVTPEAKQYFADLGARGEVLKDLNWELSGSFSQSMTRRLQLQQVTGAIHRSREQITESNYKEWDVASHASGPLLQLPGGPAKFALGGGHSNETYATQISLLPVQNPELSRDVNYAFGELAIPIFSEGQQIPAFNRLSVDLSTRWSRYSDFGTNTSSRAGLLWSPVRSLNIRATWAQFFKAPYLTQLDPTGSDYILATLADYGAPDIWTPDNSGTILYAEGNNQSLHPERGTSKTVGMDFIPQNIHSLKISATYFLIHYNERINQPDPSQAGLYDPAAYSYLFTVHPTPAQVAAVTQGEESFNDLGVNSKDPAAVAAVTTVLYDNRLRNLSRSVLDGMDLSTNFGFDIDAGRIELAEQLSYFFSYKNYVLPDTAPIPGTGVLLTPSKLKARGSANYSYAGLDLGVGINFVKAYQNTLNPAVPRVSSWTTVDMTASYSFSAGPQPLNGLKVSVSVQNLFDRAPPFVPVSGNSSYGLGLPVGFDPTNADPLGRFVSVALSKRW